jgi:AraC family transcriptional regulator
LEFIDITERMQAREMLQRVQADFAQALGVVISHELMRRHTAKPVAKPEARGGLAAWQERTVVAYIEDLLAEPISLATLAQLARLSPYHFSRAFKQSFGRPPHRYHTGRASSAPRPC